MSNSPQIGEPPRKRPGTGALSDKCALFVIMFALSDKCALFVIMFALSDKCALFVIVALNEIAHRLGLLIGATISSLRFKSTNWDPWQRDQ
jgi:hypothetical protein